MHFLQTKHRPYATISMHLFALYPVYHIWVFIIKLSILIEIGNSQSFQISLLFQMS